MAGKRHDTQAPWPFSASLGGMMASLIAISVFWILLGTTGEADESAALMAGLLGMAATSALLVGGLSLLGPLPWLASSLFFAGGFTAVWSSAISVAAEPKLPAFLAMGAAIVLVTVSGWRRFSRAPAPTVAPAGESGSWRGGSPQTDLSALQLGGDHDEGGSS